MTTSLWHRLAVIITMMACLLLIFIMYTSRIVRTISKVPDGGYVQHDQSPAKDDSLMVNRDQSQPIQITGCLEKYQSYLKRVIKYDKIRQEATKPSKINRTDYNILILTPVSDSAKSLHIYFALLCSLTYPHNRISIAIGEDSSRDGTFDLANRLATDIRPAFDSVTVYKLPARSDKFFSEQKHDKLRQLSRRRHLATARNHLLMNAINKDHDWVLWLDSDVLYYPPNLIQLLLSPAKSIVAPICLWRDSVSGVFDVYDKNTWRETNKSRNFVAKSRSANPDFLMLEGYSSSRRLYLSDLRHEGTVVPLDGVGGCTLLVNATCHRSGLIFPPFVFDSHIETEALAKMANKMDIKIYGLPFVSVIHD